MLLNQQTPSDLKPIEPIGSPVVETTAHQLPSNKMTPIPRVVTASPRPVPLVPDDILKQHAVFVGTDSRFAAACRLLAALWRTEQGLPAGQHRTAPRRARGSAPSSKPAVDETSKSVRMGSRLSTVAARAGATFLTPDIAAYAREVLLFREFGSLWEEGRLWGNLLSSQALTLNLFAPLALDLDFATAVFKSLLPDGFVGTVTGIRFEHSPDRRGPDYYGDGTAFDTIIDIITTEGEPAFIVLEIKYTEGAGGIVPAPRARYAETTQASGLYRGPNAEVLNRPGIEQLRREHVMAQLMLQYGLAGRGYFVLLGPSENRHVQAMGQLYAAELLDPTEGAGRVGFSTLTLETVMAAIARAGAADFATSFTARYLDLDRVAHYVLAEPVRALPANRALTGRTKIVDTAAQAKSGMPSTTASSSRDRTKPITTSKPARSLVGRPKRPAKRGAVQVNT